MFCLYQTEMLKDTDSSLTQLTVDTHLIRKVLGVGRGETDPHFRIYSGDLIQKVSKTKAPLLDFIVGWEATAEVGGHCCAVELDLWIVPKTINILTK